MKTVISGALLAVSLAMTADWLCAQDPVLRQPSPSIATDTASLGPELTTSGSCNGTGWTGTYPNYIAPGTSAALTCTGFASGQFYQTVTSIGAGGSGGVTVAIGTAQTVYETSGIVTAGLKANGTALTYTPDSTYTGTIGISAKLITPISTFSYVGRDSTNAVSTQFLRQTLASLVNDFGDDSGAYCTTCSYNSNSGAQGLFSITTGSANTNSGFQGMASLTTGNANTNSGLQGMLSLTTGILNTNSGYQGMAGLTTGSFNSALGYQAGRYVTGGSVANQTSSYSLYLGINTMAKTDGDTNELVLGYNATGAGSNTAVIGNGSVTDVYFGSATPAATLHSSSIALTGASFTLNGKTCTIVGTAISCI